MNAQQGTVPAAGSGAGWVFRMHMLLGMTLFLAFPFTRLVHSRFGLHVVEVLERIPGEAQTFDAVRKAVVLALRRQTYLTTMWQYLMLLARVASVERVDLDAAAMPLVQ